MSRNYLLSCKESEMHTKLIKMLQHHLTLAVVVLLYVKIQFKNTISESFPLRVIVQEVDEMEKCDSLWNKAHKFEQIHSIEFGIKIYIYVNICYI